MLIQAVIWSRRLVTLILAVVCLQAEPAARAQLAFSASVTYQGPTGPTIHTGSMMQYATVPYSTTSHSVSITGAQAYQGFSVGWSMCVEVNGSPIAPTWDYQAVWAAVCDSVGKWTRRANGLDPGACSGMVILYPGTYVFKGYTDFQDLNDSSHNRNTVNPVGGVTVTVVHP